MHIGHESEELDNALRVINQHYQLTPAQELNNIPANRFEKFAHFFQKLYRDGQDSIDYLAIKDKPEHQHNITPLAGGISVVEINPYYILQGLPQKGYDSLNELVHNLTQNPLTPQYRISTEAKNSRRPNGNWVIVSDEKRIILRSDDRLISLKYFIQNNLYYPLPSGQDLYQLSQISKRHLYWPERFGLKLNAFFSRIPHFCKNFFNSVRQFVVHYLLNEFFNHVHEGHLQKQLTPSMSEPNEELKKIKSSLHDALEKGLLANGQSLEEFIHNQIVNNPYVIARANHPPSPPCMTILYTDC